MRVFGRILGLGAAVLGAMTLAQPGAKAAIVPVDLELALVVDMSGSVDQSEFVLQRDGYKAAFESTAVQDAIAALSGSGGIAVSLFYFSTDTSAPNGLKIDWTQLDSAADAAAFAVQIGNLTETDPGSGGIGNTNIAAGIDTAMTSMASNSFDGLRQTIDVSSDGVQNTNLDGTRSSGSGCSGSILDADCAAVLAAARDAAEAANITVNGLAIDPGVSFGSLTLLDYFNAFVITSDGFAAGAGFNADFAEAIEGKIFREISGVVPEPSSLLLFALGLLGLGLWARRRPAIV